MIVRKASAGSGKTHLLAGKYLEILLNSEDRYAYRHILAVTFTNKATAEMKERILRDLAKEAQTDERARTILVDILHDYSAFSVSTIDAFFQRALKAFSREIGQSADYQVELDKNSLVIEAMDRILDGLTPDKKEVIDWIRESVSDSLSQGKKANIEGSLYEIGARLRSEERRKLLEDGADGSFSPEKLKALRAVAGKEIRGFSAAAGKLGVKVIPGEKIKKPGVKALAADSDLADLFSEPYRRYCTAWALHSIIFSLGLAGEFDREFESLVKEKNVMCLDDSTRILRDLIDGSDAPFVYEKLGVRYENFLLDEFQDTSHIQWENFLPLLVESESKGGTDLIVGDVKQSIYRWRDSDWELLASEVQKQFPSADMDSMEFNWRSLPEVIRFNNRFFTFAAGKVGKSDLYSDVEQEIPQREDADPQNGLVTVSFCDDQLEETLSCIAEARDCGAAWRDIAVLVRGHKEGGAVAQYLMAAGVPVISDDSLNLKSSIVARRLVSLLSCIDDPLDRLNSYLAESLSVSIPNNYDSLLDLCEHFIREMSLSDPAPFEGETLFIQAFMDDLRAWTATNGNSIRHYLKHWKESDIYIGSPEGTDAVRIITVHKSKGLQFPCLIFPFADKVNMYRPETHWCVLEADGRELPAEMSGVYPVELSKSSLETGFDKAFEEERDKQAVDNLNVFYVALTRAEKALYVIAKQPSKTTCAAVAKKKKIEYSNYSEVLYEYLGGNSRTVIGTPYDYTRMKREKSDGTEPFDASYTSYDRGERLFFRADASDFFGEDGLAGTASSPRLNGIALHNILSAVRTEKDLAPAIAKAVCCGDIDEEEGRKDLALLEEAVRSHPLWFSPDVEVLCEVPVYDADGCEHRPDRVVIDGDSVEIIDYKFGLEAGKYRGQVARYCALYRALGYKDVRGTLWYVRENTTESI